MRHVTSTFLVSLLFVSLSFVDTANAQICGAGVIGVGPIGVGVIVDCPPPPPPPVVVVRPRVRRVYHHAPPPPPPPVVRQAPLPPPPPILTQSQPFVPRLTLGIMMDSSSYSDGGLVGGGVLARYLLSENLAVEGHISGLGSCTSCNELAYRNDARVGIAGLYFLNPVQAVGMNLYVKGGVTFNTITYENDVNWDFESTSQTNLEVGGGIEWRLTPYLSLNAEITAMGAIGGSEIGHGPISEPMAKGIPGSDLNNGAVNFRLGVSTHF